ncbi:MAG: hypothetical protein GX568_02130 [Candidatus Gastranaerophilales bacterium]|nr:hypothetical protein [Candidatus Gastranaerophilales bacterium]
MSCSTNKAKLNFHHIQWQMSEYVKYQTALMCGTMRTLTAGYYCCT